MYLLVKVDEYDSAVESLKKTYTTFQNYAHSFCVLMFVEEQLCKSFQWKTRSLLSFVRLYERIRVLKFGSYENFLLQKPTEHGCHYSDVIMSTVASQITGGSIVFSIVCSGVDQRKHQSSASLAFVKGIHQWPVNSPHKGPVTRKMFPFDDVIMQ